VPNNPLIAESLYLTRYIEKAGSGTQRMIELCRSAGLPEPEFEQRSGSFVITLWRDWLTDKVIESLRINDRQISGLKTLKVEQQITTMQYQRLVGCSRRTAARDLDELLDKGVIQRLGAGRSAYYVLARNYAITLPIVPSPIDATSGLKGLIGRSAWKGLIEGSSGNQRFHNQTCHKHAKCAIVWGRGGKACKGKNEKG